MSGVQPHEKADGPEAPQATATARLRGLGAALAAARARLATREQPDPVALLQLLGQRLPTPADAEHPTTVADARLVLLDEISHLVGQLESERDLLRAQLQSWRSARRAEASYRAEMRSR